MNGTKPKFLENKTVRDGYYSAVNPYVNAPSCNVNLVELSRYAKSNDKKLVDLTDEEVKKFSLK